MMATPGTSYLAKERFRGSVARRYEAKRRRSGWEHRTFSGVKSALDDVLSALPPGMQVLDCPCGTGRFLPVLSRRAGAVVATDISREMVLEMCDEDRRGAVGLVQSDAEHLPFRDGAFDLAVCMRFFHLIPRDVACSALREAARVSRRGVVLEMWFLDDASHVKALYRARRLFRRLRDPARRQKVAAALRPRNGRGREARCRRRADLDALLAATGLRLKSLRRTTWSQWTLAVLELPSEEAGAGTGNRGLVGARR